MAKFKINDRIRHINSKQGIESIVIGIDNDSYTLSTDFGKRYLDFGNEPFWELCNDSGVSSASPIPFDTNDTEKKKWIYPIKDGFKAKIVNNNIIVEPNERELTEFEDELANVIFNWPSSFCPISEYVKMHSGKLLELAKKERSTYTGINYYED